LWLDTVEVHLLREFVNEQMGLVLTKKQEAQLQKTVDRYERELDGLSSVEEEATDGSKKDEGEDKVAKLFELKLVGYDAKSKIKVIKEMRTIVAGLGLKEAKEMVESVPKVFQKDLKEDAANEIKAKLEAVGGEVEMK